MLLTHQDILIGLKQHTFIISQFPLVKDLSLAELSSLLRISVVCNQGFSCTLFSCGGLSRKESISKLIQLLVRIQFLCSCRTVELKVQASGFLLIRSYLYLLEATCNSQRLPTVSYHGCFPNMATHLIKLVRRISRKQSVSKVESFYDITQQWK